ncbi:MAG: hypothetical protein A3E84_05635 [Gammaproteobacteria bacterium RIFCSPHIGHO2_12_FULL_42_13]|nr:MAG: hypothetical protein A3E84_05635 [Gammaproteobacteria bacterium RIFCSPHIGHO2_12_FULL_42_13]
MIGLRFVKHYRSLLLLCIGYFVDFYDLTIFSVGYSALFQDQFSITDTKVIHQLYFSVGIVQTVGILLGAVICGLLADRFGRACVLKYSIFLYSVSTFLVLFTHSLPLFFLLRFLAYFGLATEFSTSTVLLVESMPLGAANVGVSLLYIFGVLGGLTATVIGFLSWKIMFLLGSVVGLVVYALRSHILESSVFLRYCAQTQYSFSGMLQLLRHRNVLKTILRYFLMIIPYQAIITIMFVFPAVFFPSLPVGFVIKKILSGFFLGNIISCVVGAYLTHITKSYKTIMYIAMLLFLALMTEFYFLNTDTLFLYALCLGLIGGGYPVAWGQQLALTFSPVIRATASNLLFALGRAFGIILNILMIQLIAMPPMMATRLLFWLDVVIGVVGLWMIYRSKNFYHSTIKTIGSEDK